jgi:hypothetical protein
MSRLPWKRPHGRSTHHRLEVLMSALVWLTIPVGALLLALLWVAWATRTRPRADTHDTVEAHRRFRAAFDAHRPDVVPTQRLDADEQHSGQHRDSA